MSGAKAAGREGQTQGPLFQNLGDDLESKDFSQNSRRPGPVQDEWELIELFELRKDFENLLALTKKAAKKKPGLIKDFQALVEEHRLYEVVKVERGPGAVRLTLANLWRLTRAHGRRSLILHSFDLKSGQWLAQNQEEIAWRAARGPFPDSDRPERIWPIMSFYYDWTGYRFQNLLAALLEKVLFRLQAVKIVLGDRAGASRTVAFRRVRVQPSKLPTQALDSAFKRHIWDRELLDLLFPLRGHEVILSQYLAAQAQWEALERIGRKTPNRPPLLNFIPPAAWSRPDLWQDRVLRASAPIFSRMSARALRWLRRAPAHILDSFLFFFYDPPYRNYLPKEYWPTAAAGMTVEVLAGLSPQALKEPELADFLIVNLFSLLHTLRREDFADPLVARLPHLLARHISKLRGHEGLGLKRYREGAGKFWVEHSDLSYRSPDFKDFGSYSIIGWFLNEGRERGLPDKKSTWASLKRRSDQWHEETLPLWKFLGLEGSLKRLT